MEAIKDLMVGKQTHFYVIIGKTRMQSLIDRCEDDTGTQLLKDGFQPIRLFR